MNGNLERLSALCEVDRSQSNRLVKIHKDVLRAAKEFVGTPFLDDVDLEDLFPEEATELINRLIRAQGALESLTEPDDDS